MGNCSITLVTSLKKLLKKSARLILDEVLDRQNTTPSHVLYTNLRWMSIPETISYHRAVQMYKCLDGMCNQGMNEMFQLNRQVHKYKTRAASNHNIHVSHSHSKSFMNLGTQIWIPPHIRNSKCLTNFKQLYVQQHFSQT